MEGCKPRAVSGNDDSNLQRERVRRAAPQAAPSTKTNESAHGDGLAELIEAWPTLSDELRNALVVFAHHG